MLLFDLYISADFLKTNQVDFTAISMKKGQNAGFLASDKLENSTSKEKGEKKKKKKERARRKRGGEQ